MSKIVEPIVEKTLIFGAGGGYDIYSCVPWFVNLSKSEQDNCMLANYTFTDDIYWYATESQSLTQEQMYSDYFVKIDETTKVTKKNKDYFPELHLSIFLNKPVFAVRMLPCPTLFFALDEFVQEHNIKRIILVDGGVDLCLFGNETMFGSPAEDSQTFLACHEVSVRRGLSFTLVCCALGVDAVSIDQFKQNWAALDQKVTQVIPMTETNCNFKEFKRLLDDSKSESIIQCSLLAAMEGHRGIYVNPRLRQKIDNESCMPDLTDETLLLWKTDGFEFFKKSPFYKSLVEQWRPMWPQQSCALSVQQSCAKREQQSCATQERYKQPEKDWMVWSEFIHKSLVFGRICHVLPYDISELIFKMMPVFDDTNTSDDENDE